MRTDYREVLKEQDFAVFAQLRSLRKAVAEREGVPAYALFTNEHLAEMVLKRAATATALGTIEGVGKARMEKYGALFLDVLGKAFGASERAAGGGDEAPAHRAE
jgi:superfamily II DNA helicase RecQ